MEIQANNDGLLQVERNIIHGPKPISDYDIHKENG